MLSSPISYFLHQRLKTISMVIFVLSLPFSIGLNNIAIIATAIGWVAESSPETKLKRAYDNRYLLLCLTSLFFISLVGLSYTQDERQGWFEIEKRLTLLLFPIVFFTSNPMEKKEIIVVFKAFILACVLASSACLAYACYRNYQEGHTLVYIFKAIFFDEHLPGRYEYLNYYYFTHHFFSEAVNIHPIYLSMYILFSCVLIVWLHWENTKFRTGMSLSVISLLIFNVVVMVLLSSRMQLILLFVLAVLFMFYYFNRRGVNWIGILGVTLLIAISAAIILLNPISRERFTSAIDPTSHYSENVHGEGGLSMRLYNWRYSISAIKHNLIFGVGTGDTQKELQKIYKDRGFELGYELQLNSHNQYLQTTLELGLVGLAALVSGVFLPMFMAMRKQEWLAFVFGTIVSIGFLSESMLQLNKGIVFISFFNSLLAFRNLDNRGITFPIGTVNSNQPG